MKLLLWVKLNQNERGAVIPLIAVCLLVILAVAGLAIDSSREELSVTELQTIADSAALAGAGILRGTKDSWGAAKRLVVASVVADLQNIYGYQGTANNVVLNSGTLDPYEPAGSNYSGTTGHIGNIDLTVERGAFWASGPYPADMGFVPLEGTASASKKYHFGVPSHLIGNAVRVSLKLNNYSFSFANIFSVNSGTGAAPGVDNFTRQATAVMDNKVDACVFPIAIPACALMNDINADRPVGALKYQTNQYQAGSSCQREIIARETDAKSVRNPNPTLDQLKRIEGIVRSDSHNRYAYQNLSGSGQTICFPGDVASGAHRNCLAIPMEGVFGLPALNQLGGPGKILQNDAALGTEIESVIANGGCIPTRLGARFRPLEDAFSGYLDNPVLSNDLATLINNQANPRLVDIFGAKTSVDPVTGLPVTTTDSNTTTSDKYPNVRTYRGSQTFTGISDITNPVNLSNQLQQFVNQIGATAVPSNPLLLDPMEELRLEWAVNGNAGGNYRESLIMKDMISPDFQAGENWTGQWGNPMCHDSQIMNVDHPDARAMPVVLMIIASANPQANNPYCDFDSAVAGTQQDSFPPMSGTDPIVVGFKQAYLYDFNVTDLEQAQYAVDPATGNTIDAAGNPYDPQYGSPSFARMSISPGVVRPPLVDENPVMRDPLKQSANFAPLVADVKQVIQDHLTWVQCAIACGTTAGGACASCNLQATALQTGLTALSNSLTQAPSPAGALGCFGDPKGNMANLLSKLQPSNNTINWLMYGGPGWSGNYGATQQLSSLTDTNGVITTKFHYFLPVLDSLQPAEVYLTRIDTPNANGGYDTQELFDPNFYDHSRWNDKFKLWSWDKALSKTSAEVSTLASQNCGMTSPCIAEALASGGCPNICQPDPLNPSGPPVCSPDCSLMEQACYRAWYNGASATIGSPGEGLPTSFKPLSRQVWTSNPLDAAGNPPQEPVWGYYYQYDLNGNYTGQYGMSFSWGMLYEMYKVCPNTTKPLGVYPRANTYALGNQYNSLLNNLMGWGTSKPNTHCLPRKIQNCWDPSDPACWESPRPRRSGWGCGGARLRLSCGGADPETIPSLHPVTNFIPALVK